MTLTDAGIAVIEDDTLLSSWIRQEGRLDLRFPAMDVEGVAV